jgi:copper chaperone CopZ
MATTTFSAPDIECDGCANAIKKSVGGMAGVNAVNVDVPAKTVRVEHDESPSEDQILATLDRAGFPAEVAAG